MADASAFAQPWGSWRGRFQARRSHKNAYFVEDAAAEGWVEQQLEDITDFHILVIVNGVEFSMWGISP